MVTGTDTSSSGKPAQAFFFDASKYVPPSVSPDLLNKMADAFFGSAGGSWLDRVWSGIVLVVAFAYIWGWNKLISAQEALAKQQYEIAQAGELQNETGDTDPTPPLPPSKP